MRVLRYPSTRRPSTPLARPSTRLCHAVMTTSQHLHGTQGHPSPCAPPKPGDTLIEAAYAVLQQPDALLKAQYTFAIHELWGSGQISEIQPRSPVTAPERPARDDKVKVLPPGKIPDRGKGGSLASRQALLHSLVHIENTAIDLSWDVIVRFGTDPSYQLPRQFFSDFVQVAEDECRHFSLLQKRLEEIGSHYGAHPTHDGLWASAMDTRHSLPARLAIESCCHEARGLDMMPPMIAKFRDNGDKETAALLEDVIYVEEITHCAAGVRWLKYLHALAQDQEQQQQQQQQAAEAQQQEDTASGAGASSSGGSWVAGAQAAGSVQSWFHQLVRAHFKGKLKPPFNTEARAKAGFDESWYLPLAVEAPAKKKPAAAKKS